MADVTSGREGDNRKPAKPGSLSRPLASPAVCIATGIGLLLGSTWASRGQDVFGSVLFFPGGRVIAICCLVAIAAAISRRRHRKPGRMLLAASVASWLGHAACLLLGLYAPASAEVRIALGFSSCVFVGVLIATALLALLMAATTLPARAGRLAVASGLLVATTYDMLFVHAGATVAVWQWVIAELVVILCLWRTRDVIGRGPDPEGGARSDGGRNAGASWLTPETTSWAFATVVIFVLMLMQGIVVQTTGYGGAGGGARYGVAGDIFSLITRMATVVYCLYAVEGPRPVGVATSLSLTWSVALVAIAVGWYADAASFGELLFEVGYNLAQAFALLLALGHAHRHPDHTTQALCAGSAAMLANQVTREVGLVTIDATQSGPALVACVAAGCLGVLAAGYAICAFLLARRCGLASPAAKSERTAAGAGRTATAARPDVSPAPGAPAPADVAVAAVASPSPLDAPFLSQEKDFARRFERVCDERGLTRREREVLFTALHGYTIDNVADRLTISRETVKSDLSRAYARAGVNGKQAFLALMDRLT